MSTEGGGNQKSRSGTFPCFSADDPCLKKKKKQKEQKKKQQPIFRVKIKMWTVLSLQWPLDGRYKNLTVASQEDSSYLRS